MADRVGFVGLGIMGGGMAANLVRGGTALTVYNRTAERAAPLVELGAVAERTPRAVAENSDVVIICVSDTADVEEVIFGADGVADGLAPGGLVIDTSTVSPTATRQWADRLAEVGVAFIDAPLTGGSEGAEQGTLSIMVGGADGDVERALPYLRQVGSTITHVGPVGHGQVTKLANQILVVSNMLGVAEALMFARASGLDLAKVIAAVEGGAGGSWMLSKRAPQVIDDDWRPGFRVDLQQKDLRLVLEAAGELRVPMLATGLISQLYQPLLRDGRDGDGNHALAETVARLAGQR
ncbi:NAD(P)-dependent oxidoreductase [Microlunatus sp. GCM10028923]|uniref:NAD(P)-dependent oxidoreductase n=1 Tax=Microlunatus sp. GCM10028923 TaxID=3273400 RepID=UPI0036127F83